MKRMYSLVLVLILFSCHVLGQNNPHSEEKTILYNGKIVNPSLSASPRVGTIIVENGVIDTIIYEKNAPIQKLSGKVYDITDQYVIPGLIDTHVHLATAGALDPDLHKNQRLKELELRKMLFSGVTTVRDMTGNGVILAYYKRASRYNQIPAPSIFYAAQFAGPEYFRLVKRSTTKENSWVGARPFSRIITDTTDIVQAVVEAKGAGVTGIKVYNDLSPALVKEITKEAHKQGVQVWSHSAVFPALPMDIAKAGVNTMSHAYDMAHQINPDQQDKYKPIDPSELDKVFDVMKRKGIILDATNYSAINNKLSNGVKITKRAKDKGIPISTGTDWPYSIDKKVPLLEEMQILKDSVGFTNAEVLTSATVVGAQSIGLKDRGVIEQGKRADLIVLSNNPLKNLEALKEPDLVVKDGKVYHPW